MYQTSDWWLENQQKNICSEGKVRIFQTHLDDELQKNASVSVTDVASFCNPSSLLSAPGQKIEKYVTMEENLALLDGTGIFPPDVNYAENIGFGKTGFVSGSLCDDSGMFTSPVVVNISMNFLVEKDVDSFTVQWSTLFRECPKDAKIKFFNNDTQVGNTIRIKEKKYFTVFDIKNIHFNRIEITIDQWCLPGRRARIEGVFFGSVWEISNEHLRDFTYEMEVFNDNSSLSVKEISFQVGDVLDTEPTWSPIDFWEISLYQRLFLEVGFKEPNGEYEMIPMGVYYVSKLRRDEEKRLIDVVANDVISTMNEPYLISTYDPLGESVYDVVEKMLLSVGLKPINSSVPPYYISEHFKNEKLYAPLPLVSVHECLQLLAHEYEGVLYTDRFGTVHFRRDSDVDLTIWDGKVVGLDSKFFYDTHFVAWRNAVRRVIVHENEYKASGEGRVLYEKEMKIDGVKTVWCKYGTPAALVSSKVTGGTVQSEKYYLHACELKISSTKDQTVKIIVEGFPVERSQTEITHDIDDVPFGSIVVIDNALRTKDTSSPIMLFVWMTGKGRFSVSSARINPAIDVWDLIRINGRIVIIQKVKFSFNGIFRGSIEGIML